MGLDYSFVVGKTPVGAPVGQYVVISDHSLFEKIGKLEGDVFYKKNCLLWIPDGFIDLRNEVGGPVHWGDFG